MGRPAWDAPFHYDCRAASVMLAAFSMAMKTLPARKDWCPMLVYNAFSIMSNTRQMAKRSINTACQSVSFFENRTNWKSKRFDRRKAARRQGLPPAQQSQLQKRRGLPGRARDPRGARAARYREQISFWT